MRAVALCEFLDAETGVVRKPGESFEVSRERFERLRATKWGALVEAAKKEKKER